MSQPSKRARRVADLVQREVANCLQREVRDPRLTGISITEVDMSPDMKSARVYFSLLNDAAVSDAQKAIEKADRFIRHYLAKNAELRYTPKLIFKYDDTAKRAEHLSRLIDKTRSHDYKKEDLDDEKTS
ncbi:MAG: 30S ribosome-binding factor RbfA [Gammaproteobacteria bacterium]|nr:30S ribosome-binding factor RbfA [Gammaproteobacteria bacterium]MCH9743667.1 30S ribosome-binding factor RbfA [Gammaproteobacteria bacterium]